MTLSNTATPSILYIDLDSCFATAQQQANPLLRGQPIVVAAYATDKGCILSPSIEAKKFGIKTGMRVWEAKKKVPWIVVCPPDTHLYRDIHRSFISVLETYCPIVVAKSIDEAIVDFSEMGYTETKLLDIGNKIKQDIRQHVGEWISSSVGISTNRNLAKLAATLDKPDGLLSISSKNIRAVLSRAKLTDFAGINVRTQLRLLCAGIKDPIDFLDASYETLRYKVFRSVLGYQWFLRLRGWEVDDQEIERKTYGQQYALPHPTKNTKELFGILLKLTEKMGRRMRKKHMGAKGMFVSCRHTDHTEWHGIHRSDGVISTTRDLFSLVQHIFSSHPQEFFCSLLSVTSFCLCPLDPYQQELFPDNTKKTTIISDAMDCINDRYGEYTIYPASMMGTEHRVIDRISFGQSAIQS